LSTDVAYSQSDWVTLVIFLGIIIALVLVGQVGFLLGRKIRETSDDPAKTQSFTTTAATFGFLALLLAFAFSAGGTRFANRKQLMVDEANAIGTTHLRAKLLPEPYGSEAASLLRDYVDVRVEWHRALDDGERLAEANEATQDLQQQLWARAVAAGKEDPRAETYGLFIQSLNEAIDLQTLRLASVENRIPPTALYLLLLAAILSVMALGYGAGLGNRRNILGRIIVALLIVVVIFVVVDLDRPGGGLIEEGQKSMLRLQDSMAQTTASQSLVESLSMPDRPNALRDSSTIVFDI
jgi:MFS family permease